MLSVAFAISGYPAIFWQFLVKFPSTAKMLLRLAHPCEIRMIYNTRCNRLPWNLSLQLFEHCPFVSNLHFLSLSYPNWNYLVNHSPPSRCTRLEEGASIRRSLFSRLRGVKFTGRFLTVQTLQTILCSELTPASQPILCKVILYSQYILSECYV